MLKTLPHVYQTLNPFKRSGVKWLHFTVFRAMMMMTTIIMLVGIAERDD